MANRAPVDTGDLWRWVDRLTRPRKRRLVRHEHGAQRRIEWAELPSLHQQLEEAKTASTSGGGRGKASTGSRAPLNLDVTALLADIASTTIDALVAHDVHPHRKHSDPRTRALGIRVLDIPACLRQLPAVVVGTGDQDLVDWWADRYRSWVARAEEALALEDDDTLDVRPVRGVACPTCTAQYVVDVRDAETYLQPAMVISFRDGQVLHVTCRACDAGWWRGEEIDQLGALVAVPTPRAADDVAATVTAGR